MLFMMKSHLKYRHCVIFSLDAYLFLLKTNENRNEKVFGNKFDRFDIKHVLTQPKKMEKPI